MTLPERPRSTRDRPAKAPLSEEAIVDAALSILRSEGLEAVTMRRVATELDTGAASLYVYIAGREELRNAMLGRVAAHVKLEEPDPGRWREQVHALLGGVLTAMEAHPGIASVAVANPPRSPDALDFAENLLGLLLAGEVRPQDAAWACDMLPLITTASAIETDVWRARGTTVEDQRDWVGGLRRTFRSRPPPVSRCSPASPASWSPATEMSASTSRSTRSSTAWWLAHGRPDRTTLSSCGCRSGRHGSR